MASRVDPALGGKRGGDAVRAPGYCWKQNSPAVTCCPPACCPQAIAAALDHTGPSPFGPNSVAVPKNPWPTPVQPPQFAGEPPLEAAVPSGDVPVHTDCSCPWGRVWPNASMTIGLSSLESVRSAQSAAILPPFGST